MTILKDLSFHGKYTPPHIGADEVTELLGNAKDAAILDAATGTGLVGLHVRKSIHVSFQICTNKRMVKGYVSSCRVELFEVSYQYSAFSIC